MIELMSNGKTYNLRDVGGILHVVRYHEVSCGDKLLGTLVQYVEYKRFAFQSTNGRWELNAKSMPQAIEELSTRL